VRAGSRCLVALTTVAASGLTAGAVSADNSVNFGCTKDGRTIAARAYYSSSGSLWKVSRIEYTYSNSGGGKTDSKFTVFNGTNAVAWTWKTPDNRDDGSYEKSVDTPISRGPHARAYQQTHFDQFGPDPSCTNEGYF
jgi:hypothetical protein